MKIFPVVVKKITSAGAAVVRWTPGSDSGLKPEIGVQATMTQVSVNRDQNIGVQAQFNAMTLARSQSIGVESRFDLAVNRNQNIAVQAGFTALALSRDQSVGVQSQFNAMTLARNQSVGVESRFDLALKRDQSIGVQSQFSTFALVRSQNIGVQAALPALTLSRNQSVGVQSTGSVLGAPFFKTVTAFGSTAAAASHVVNTPTGTVDGDFLLAIVGASAIFDPGVINAPTGWTQIGTQITTNGSSLVFRYAAFWKFASGEGTTLTFTSSAGNKIITVMRIVGVDSTTPVNVSDTATGSAVSPVAPSITTTVVNCMKVCACVQQNATAVSYTPPANYDERADLNASNLGVNNQSGETATRVQAATGASGTATMTSTQLLASAYIAAHIAIAPATLILA